MADQTATPNPRSTLTARGQQWPIELFIAWRYVLANVKQSLIVMMAVGIGVALIVFIPALNSAFYARMLKRAVERAPQITVTREIDTYDRNLNLLKQQYDDGTQVSMTDKTLSRRRHVVAYRTTSQRLQELPGVTEVAPFVAEQVIVVRGNQVLGGDMRGIIPELEDAVSHIGRDVEQGKLETLNGNEVFLGHRLADDLGVDLGSRVQLMTAYGNRSFKVAGTLNSGLSAADSRSVIVSLRTAQRLLGMSNEVTGLGLKVSDPYGAEELSTRIHEQFGLKAKSWMEENKLLLKELNDYQGIMMIMNFLIVFAAASSITSVLIMVVSNKSREIGILKAMGTSRWQIVRLFMIQAMFLSLLGAITGATLGVGLVELYNASPMATAETAWGFSMEPVPLPWMTCLEAFGYAMVSSFLASLVPAWQAGSLDPVKAMNQ